MRCKYSENDIALLVERDLAAAKMDEIEAHLVACDGCRFLAQELRESQAIFKSLRQDAVTAAALSSVRTRVLSEVGAGNVKAGWGRWVYALAGVAFMAVIGIGLAWQLRKPAAPQVQQIVNSEALPGVAAPLPVVVSPALTSGVSGPPAKVRKRDRRPPRPPAVVPAEDSVEPPRQTVVKLLTDDPNIVIYWLVDQKNGGSL